MMDERREKSGKSAKPNGTGKPGAVEMGKVQF